MGCYADDVEAGQRAVQPFREIADPLLDMSEPMPYELFHDLGTMMFPEGRNDCHRSVYVDALDDEVFDVVASEVETAPSPLSDIGVWHLGGAIRDAPADATAYLQRDAGFILTVEANWEGAGENWAERVYADNFDRLRSIKTRYDGSNDLAENVNVPPSRPTTDGTVRREGPRRPPGLSPVVTDPREQPRNPACPAAR